MVTTREGLSARLRWAIDWTIVLAKGMTVAILLLAITLPIYLLVVGWFGPDPGEADAFVFLLYAVAYLLVLKVYSDSLKEARFGNEGQ